MINFVFVNYFQAFTNSSDLNKHTRVHDPSLKIKCDHCDKTFAQRVNLKNHMIRHHNPEGNIKKASQKAAAKKKPKTTQ